MENTYSLSEHPSIEELGEALIFLGNNLAKIGNLMAKYKNDVAYAATQYKRACARALVKNQDAKNATLARSLAEIDDIVITTQDKLDRTNAVFTLCQAEFEGTNAQFVAIRKLVEIKKMEYKSDYGNGI